MGLDTEAFNACMDTGKYTEQIQTDSQTAQQIGVQSTPSFLVNGTPLVGAQPFTAFQQLIDPFVK